MTDRLHVAGVTLFATVCVLIFLFFTVSIIKGFHHEFMHLPGLVVCSRYAEPPALDYEVTGRSAKTVVKTWDIGRCTFYWHENNRYED